MNLILRPSGGLNIVLRPQARPAYYGTRDVPPAQVEVYWRYADEPAAAARLVGRYAPGAKVSFPYNPLEDKNIIITTVSIAADGTRSVRERRDGVEQTLTFQRETAAPVIGQVGDATPDNVTIGVSGFTVHARKRRLRVADALTGGGELDNPSEEIFDAGDAPMASYIDIARSEVFSPDFSWNGADPAANGFTKTGAGTTEANAGGWRISTIGSDAATYYTKDSWPAGAFAAGFTLELTPPSVADTDNADPAASVAIRIEDGTRRYELTFDADEVKLNGGTSHTHADAKVRLVVATGGPTADLWIGDTLTENNTAFQATATSGLRFGDLITTDDADAVWTDFAYTLDIVPVRLAETIYVAVAHSSGGDFTPDSEILEITFANEGSGAGGTSGDFDPIPRHQVDYDAMV